MYIFCTSIIAVHSDTCASRMATANSGDVRFEVFQRLNVALDIGRSVSSESFSSKMTVPLHSKVAIQEGPSNMVHCKEGALKCLERYSVVPPGKWSSFAHRRFFDDLWSKMLALANCPLRR